MLSEILGKVNGALGKAWFVVLLVGGICGVALQPVVVDAYQNVVVWRNAAGDPRYAVIKDIESRLPYYVVDIRYYDEKDAVVFTVAPKSQEALAAYNNENGNQNSRSRALTDLCAALGAAGRDVFGKELIGISLGSLVTFSGFEGDVHYVDVYVLYISEADFFANWCLEYDILDDYDEFRSNVYIEISPSYGAWPWINAMPRYWGMETLW